jgi:hypothetical protein
LAASDGQAVGRCVVAFDERVHCTMFGRPPHSTRLLSGTAAVRLLSGPRLAWDDPSMSGDVVVAQAASRAGALWAAHLGLS